MATRFIKATSSLSIATYQKVVASVLTPNMTSTGPWTSLATERTIAFTASEGGTLEGVYLCLHMRSRSAVQSVTAHLETNSGGWADVAGVTKTITYEDIVGGGAGSIYASMCWVYFEFGATQVIDTSADTWRIKVQSTDANAEYINETTSGMSYAVVIQETGTFTSGDNLLTHQGITVTVDQTQTFGSFMLGEGSTLTWTNPPVASYTFTATTFYLSTLSNFIYGTSGTRIASAVRGTIAITNIHDGSNYVGGNDNTLHIYGVEPVAADVKTTLASDAASAQKVIITSADMSAVWSPGDTIWIYGGATSNYRTVARVIDTIVGTTVTVTSNLLNIHYAGWAVVNATKAKADCGAVLQGKWSISSSPGNSISDLKCHGAYFDNCAGVFFSMNYGYGDASLIQPISIQGCIGEGGATPPGFSMISSISSYFEGSIIKDLYWLSGSGTRMTVGTYHSTTLENLFMYMSYTPIVLTGNRYTVTNVQLCSASGSNAATSFTVNSSVFTNVKNMGGSTGYGINGVNNTFTSCTSDGGTYAVNTGGIIVDTTFTDCEFGQDVANTATFYSLLGFVDAKFNNCLFDTTEVLNGYLSESLDGSLLRSQTHNQVANSHRTWSNYGVTQSTGTGLADTTAHTAGGYTIRFEPMSATNSHTWEFTVPTGSIATKTMMVGVWCKINSATYYAGTHQLPRLTIDYDNGTTAYVQAEESTDWQFLPLPFTPTTSYGQITVTISGRTDATSTNAYVYFDDFKTLYPAETPLNTQTFDLWADALPVTPPLATVLSANDVWSASSVTDYGTDTMGTFIKKMLKFIKNMWVWDNLR